MIGIKLYFCKKCKIFTDPYYWRYDINSNRPKGKCVKCGNENPKTMKEVELVKSSKPSVDIYEERNQKLLSRIKSLEKRNKELEKDCNSF